VDDGLSERVMPGNLAIHRGPYDSSRKPTVDLGSAHAPAMLRSGSEAPRCAIRGRWLWPCV
jgi:hypothetical protein